MKVYGAKKASVVFLVGLVVTLLSGSIFGQNMFRKVNDFDGDGKADFAVTRDTGGLRVWHILQSTNGYRSLQFGIDIDANTAGDFDGDGKIDIAVFRKEFYTPNVGRGTFWIFGSQSGVRSYTSPININASVVPAHQDYDGDGKTDISHTESNHSIVFALFSRAGGTGAFSTTGGDLIRIGDMNGNNSADAVGQTYNSTSGTYITRYSPAVGEPIRNVSFGVFGDQFVPADFDGDGKGDLAVFRPSNGTWWWLRSSDNAIHAAQFGQTGDVPVPADFDGDGKTDLAIWRPGETQSVFWVYGSTGNISVVPFGIGTDKVVTY